MQFLGSLFLLILTSWHFLNMQQIHGGQEAWTSVLGMLELAM